MNQPSSVVALDRVVEVLLWAMLAWLPFAFGGVLPLSHMVLVGGTGAMALLFGVRCVLRPTDLVASRAFVPLLLFLGLVGLQLWPGGAVLGGSNQRLWGEGLEPPLLAPFQPPLSLNPGATAADLRLLAALAVLFVLAAQVLRDKGALRRLLTALAVIGAGLAVVALLQDLTSADSLLWLRKAPGGRATAGPFVHYGHFSQFVNLTIGAGIGLLLLRLAERDQRTQFSVEDLVRGLGAPDRRLDLFVLGTIVAAVVAIYLSRSRNGVLSMLVAGAVTAALLQRTKYLRGMGWTLLALGALAFVVLLFVGFDPVYERLQTIEDVDLYSFRLTIAADALTAFLQFPWLGSGQGTFEDVFPLFDTSVRPGRAEHAENQYVELLVETGVVGFLLVAAFLVLVVVPWLRRLRTRRDGADGALFGLWFGVVAVAFHATSDFGLRIPSVIALAMVCVGAVVARTGTVLPASPTVRTAGAALAAIAAVALLAQLPALEQHRRAYEHVEAARLVGQRAASAETVEEQLRLRQRERSHWAAAVEAVPQQADYQIAYATAAWLSVAEAERPELLPAGDPALEEQQQRLRATASLVQKALLEARRLCAIRGDLWSLAGQLGVELLGDAAAAAWIERGYRFAPENPTTCLAWARQLLKQGDTDGAARLFPRAILMGANANEVLPAIARDFGAADVALQIARQNPRWLMVLVQRLRGDKAFEGLVADGKKELAGVLRGLVAAPEPAAWTLAGLAELEAEEGQTAEAIALYRRYLALQPGSAARLSLARLLQKSGDLDAARQEVRRLLNHQPGHAGAKRLQTELGM